jgi:hypothetical protein
MWHALIIVSLTVMGMVCAFVLGYYHGRETAATKED